MRIRVGVLLLLVSVVLPALAWAPAHAAADLFPPGTTGYDRSWPECDTPLPPQPFGFAIVGATGGRAFTSNPCLSREFAWAAGTGSLPALYMNMKSPVGTTADQALTGPKGACAPSDDACRAYNYGYKTAQHAVAYAASQGATASSWWLDIETTSSWSTDAATNAVVIGAAIDYLQAQGIAVGIYSSQTQWAEIAGSYRPGVPVWVAAAPDAATAPSYCARTFGGGQVVLVQYFVDGHDVDYACTAADRLAVVEATPLGPPGSLAVVDADGGCLNIRPAPGFAGSPSECAASGTQVTVLEGPVVADGYEWLRVSAGDVSGWVAGAYLQRVAAGAGSGSSAGTATLSAPPTASGVNAAVWSGGTVNQLLARAPGATSLWVYDGGRPYGWIVGAPAFANAAFYGLFPGGQVPSGTILFIVMP